MASRGIWGSGRANSEVPGGLFPVRGFGPGARRRLKPAAAFFLVVTSLAAVSGQPAGLAVAPDCAVPGEYPTIQAAIDDVACSNVNVAAGTFSEGLAISRSVVISGAGSGATFVDPWTAGGPAVSVFAGTGVYIENLAITTTAAP